MMERNRFPRLLTAALGILILALILAACSAGQGEAPVSPTASTQDAAQPAQPAAAEKPQDSPTSAPTAVPTDPPPDALPLKLIAQGFGQDGNWVGYALMVSNENTAYAIDEANCIINAYDATGNKVDLGSLSEKGRYLGAVFPGQTRAYTDRFKVEDGVTIDKIEISLNGGLPIASDQPDPLKIDQVSFKTIYDQHRVIGVVSNSIDRAFDYITLAAVGYNEAGEIIGSGFNYMEYLPANGSVPFDASLVTSAEPARVEVYPYFLAYDTYVTGAMGLPAGASDPVVLKQGIGRNEFGGTVVGVLVNNPNKDLAVKLALLTAAMYSEDGSLVDVAAVSINLRPEQTLGYVFFPDLPEGVETPITRVEVQVLSGSRGFVDPPSGPMLQVEVLPPGGAGGFLKVKVTNPTDSETKNLKIIAIAYDAAGEIIGGGDGFLDPLAAGGSAEATVLYTTSGEPASFEVYIPERN